MCKYYCHCVQMLLPLFVNVTVTVHIKVAIFPLLWSKLNVAITMCKCWHCSVAMSEYSYYDGIIFCDCMQMLLLTYRTTSYHVTVATMYFTVDVIYVLSLCECHHWADVNVTTCTIVCKYCCCCLSGLESLCVNLTTAVV